MSTSVNWNGTTYSIPAAGEVNWPSLSNFLIALGNNASNNITEKQAIRIATSSPVTVSATTDCTVISDLSVAGAVAMNLPAGVDGQMFFLLDGKGDAGSNNITITPNGAETIGGAATLVLNHNGQGVWIQYKASESDWYVLANIVVPGTITPADIVGVIPPDKGGTGVANNAASTLTISGNFATTLTVSGATGVTLPTTGTLATLAGSETLSNKTITAPTVTGQLLLQNPSGSQPTLALSEDPDNGTNKVVLQAPATLASDYTLTLPADDGDSGECLTTNGSGVLTWEPVVTNPMTTRGDLIRATTSGVPQRFSAVTNNRVVRGDGTDVVLGQIDNTGFFTSGAYADGTNGGTLPAVSSMGDVLATQLGYKVYQHGTSYNSGVAPNITMTGGGGTLSSVVRSAFVPYMVQDGTWRLSISFVVTVSSTARTAATFAINAVTFKNTSSWNQPLWAQNYDGSVGTLYAFAATNTSNVQVNHASATTTAYGFTGDVELNSKPSWAY